MLVFFVTRVKWINSRLTENRQICVNIILIDLQEVLTLWGKNGVRQHKTNVKISKKRKFRYIFSLFFSLRQFVEQLRRLVV